MLYPATLTLQATYPLAEPAINKRFQAHNEHVVVHYYSIVVIEEEKETDYVMQFSRKVLFIIRLQTYQPLLRG